MITPHAAELPALGHASPAAATTPLRRLAGLLATPFRALWLIIDTAADIRNELQRMADAAEATRPEHAARLRQLARAPWRE